MPLYVSITSIIILSLLSIIFAILFWKEQNNNKENKYRKGTIMKFIKDGLPIIYILLATIFGLSTIGVITAAFI